MHRTIPAIVIMTLTLYAAGDAPSEPTTQSAASPPATMPGIAAVAEAGKQSADRGTHRLQVVDTANDREKALLAQLYSAESGFKRLDAITQLGYFGSLASYERLREEFLRPSFVRNLDVKRFAETSDDPDWSIWAYREALPEQQRLRMAMEALVMLTGIVPDAIDNLVDIDDLDSRLAVVAEMDEAIVHLAVQSHVLLMQQMPPRLIAIVGSPSASPERVDLALRVLQTYFHVATEPLSRQRYLQNTSPAQRAQEWEAWWKENRGRCRWNMENRDFEGFQLPSFSFRFPVPASAPRDR